MARISAGIATSHVPLLGVAVDQDKTSDPYFEPIFAGYEWTKRWEAKRQPDVILLVYNDHASAFKQAAQRRPTALPFGSMARNRFSVGQLEQSEAARSEVTTSIPSQSFRDRGEREPTARRLRNSPGLG